MANRVAPLLIVAVLGAASAALAEPAPSTTVAPVTVQAAPTPKAIQQQSRSFVQSYGAASNPEIGQIGRWHDPVCVQVEGLAPEQAAVIKARIESVARAVGLPAPWDKGAGCKANVEIVFSDQPQAVMDVVAKRHEKMLGYHHPLETNRLKTVTHPIQAWYETVTHGEGPNGGLLFAFRDTDGHIIPPNEVPGITLDRETLDDPDKPSPTGCGDSHFSACLKSRFDNVFMVADSRAMEGKDLGVVADYMVMLALSKPRALDGCNALPSVIDVLAKSACPGRDPPNGLTPADAAYLTALYASDPEGRKWTEQDDIAGRMTNILVKANASAR
jgi:hypothetical protein